MKHLLERCAAALVITTLACRPPAPAPATRTPAAPAPAPPPTIAPAACTDPAATFARYAWLPADVHLAARLRLDDPQRTQALETLETSTAVPTSANAVARQMKADLPELLRVLEHGGWTPSEAVYFQIAPDLWIWAVPTGCDAAEFTRLTARRGLTIHSPASPAFATSAVSTAPARGFVHFTSGQLWIADPDRVPGLLAWLAQLPGPHPGVAVEPGILGFQLHEGWRASSLQLWCNDANDPYSLREVRVEGTRISLGTTHYWAPVQI